MRRIFKKILRRFKRPIHKLERCDVVRAQWFIVGPRRVPVYDLEIRRTRMGRFCSPRQIAWVKALDGYGDEIPFNTPMTIPRPMSFEPQDVRDDVLAAVKELGITLA